MSLLDALTTEAPWRSAADDFAARAHRRAKAAAYHEVVASGAALELGRAVAGGAHVPPLPQEAFVNKAGGRRKRVYLFPPAEELLHKVMNRLLQPVLAPFVPPQCHSFLPGRGARTAFGSLLADKRIGTKACLRLDVTDYFNSIDIGRLWERLPPPVLADGPLARYVALLLRNPLVLRHGRAVTAGRKGVMAGTALAPLLADVALADLDERFAAAGVTYARYSDDIAVFDHPAAVAGHEEAIRAHLAGLNLSVNEQKTGRSAPGAPWEFLGLRYDQGLLDVSANALRKAKGRVDRLARRLDRLRGERGAPPESVARQFVNRLNGSFYGTLSDRDDFCWAWWFFPVVGTDATLAAIDGYVQERLRWAATGRRTRRAMKEMPYGRMREAGYLPLVPAYWAFRTDRAAYDALIRRRALRAAP